MVRNPVARLIGFVRWLASRERLDEDQASAPRGDTGQGPESTAPGETAARPRRSWLAWLFAPEPLPFDPEPGRAGAEQGSESPAPGGTAVRTSGIGLAWLFAREPLPLDPEPARPARRSGVSLGWLLRRERLDDLPEHDDGGETRRDS